MIIVAIVIIVIISCCCSLVAHHTNFATGEGNDFAGLEKSLVQGRGSFINIRKSIVVVDGNVTGKIDSGDGKSHEGCSQEDTKNSEQLSDSSKVLHFSNYDCYLELGGFAVKDGRGE